MGGESAQRRDARLVRSRIFRGGLGKWSGTTSSVRSYVRYSFESEWGSGGTRVSTTSVPAKTSPMR